MKGKIIIIGEAWLEVEFKGSTPVATRPGGALLRASCALAAKGHEVVFLSEIGTDKPGAIIADALNAAGVNIADSDRHIAKTPILLDIDGVRSRYAGQDDGEGFDIIWPRVEKDDIVVVGGYFALDPRIRQQMGSFLSYASENARIIYVPGVADDRIKRITKVMPAVYENLELAHRVITLPDDLTVLFNHNDPQRARRENFSYYVNEYSHITDETLLAPTIVE